MALQRRYAALATGRVADFRVAPPTCSAPYGRDDAGAINVAIRVSIA